ncbi:GRAM domain-containing protein 1A [Dorcoceras hygrometricum]|uniref:GRAM domain-containing protein 1A n=1 Tax=Dorcoceras hygrometricum TaxID=472368 RepID=A0A2Z7CGK7_9LAMI|nr:GRAM domain-containing protein 1A [Dorcoceras hygrometricum]
MAAVASEKMTDLALAAAPPTAQSMDNNSVSSTFSAVAEALREPSAESPDQLLNSAPSPSKQLDSKSQLFSKLEEYRQLFRLPPDEDLIQDFNCALQENFLLQGHMYLFAHYICFYSNLFGFETKKTIPFHEVTSVRRANAVAVFPTAIEIIAGGKKYFFTSFLSRDEAFRLINDGWLLHRNGSKEITDPQEIKSDTRSQDNGCSMAEKSASPGKTVDESDVNERDKDSTTLEDSKISSVIEPEIILKSSGVQVGKKEDVQTAQTVEFSLSETSSAWLPEDADAPQVPECYTKVAESKFPIPVEEFFELFFSDNGASFQEAFHKKCGDKDFKCSSWQPHDKFGHMSEVSFQHPIKLYLGARCGSCKQIQKYRVYRNSHLVIETSQVISDVPYGDYFTVEGRWDVERDGDESQPGCLLRVSINVSFSKKTMWRGKIVQSTEEECREAYAIWIDLAHEFLKKKKLEKEEEGRAFNQAQLEKLSNSETPLDLKPRDSKISSILPDFEGVNQRVINPPQRNSVDVPVGYFFKDTLTKFFQSLRHQNSSSLLLIITIGIILLLMQISIVVLLSRSQQIHVITQGDYHTSSMIGMGSNKAESLASLKRQIKYLREEMHFVETMLEKLQHEHVQLKGKLKELELSS